MLIMELLINNKDLLILMTKINNFINVSKLFGKAYPVLSLVKSDSNNNEITIKIANPSDSDEDLTISGFTFANAYW